MGRRTVGDSSSFLLKKKIPDVPNCKWVIPILPHYPKITTTEKPVIPNMSYIEDRVTNLKDRVGDSTRVTDATGVLLSASATTQNVFRHTQDDLRAVSGEKSSRMIGKNQGIIDARTKKIQERLQVKLAKRALKAKIAQCDELMQHLLEGQDPEDEALYDKVKAKRDELEAQL